MIKTKHRNYSYLVILLAIIVIMIYRLVLTSFIGSEGLSYFSVGEILFLLFGVSIACGLEISIGILVENRMNKQLFTNAKKVVLVGAEIAILLGLVILVILFLLGHRFSNNVFDMPLSYMSVLASIFAIPFFIFSAVFRGFFRGVGKFLIVCQSYIIFAVSYSLLGITFSYLLMKYGEKVTALLRVEEYKYCYGALGAALGVLVSSIIVALHIFIMFLVMNRRTIYSDGRDYSRNSENALGMSVNVLLNSLPSIGIWGAIAFTYFLDGVFVFKNKTAEFNMEFSYGEYYGKVIPIIAIIVAIIGMSANKYIKSSLKFVYHEELRPAREMLSYLIHRCIVMGSFATAMVLVLSNNILEMLYKTNGSLVAEYLRLEAIVIFFALFAICSIKLLITLKYTQVATIICLISTLVHGIMSYILIGTAHMSIKGLIISDLIFWAVISVMGYMIIARCYQYTQEYFRNFLVTLIATGVVGFIAWLINKLIYPIWGCTVSIIIILCVSALLDMVVLLILKGYTENELVETFIGRMMLGLGNFLKLM